MFSVHQCSSCLTPGLSDQWEPSARSVGPTRVQDQVTISDCLLQRLIYLLSQTGHHIISHYISVDPGKYQDFLLSNIRVQSTQGTGGSLLSNNNNQCNIKYKPHKPLPGFSFGRDIKYVIVVCSVGRDGAGSRVSD